MFYVKSPSVNETTMNKQTFIPNNSQLHKVTHNVPSSQIPRKQTTPTSPSGKTSASSEVSLQSSVVTSFLQSINSKENSNQPVKNPSHLFKTQQTIKLTQTRNETSVNHLGLRKVNGANGESAVLNKVRDLNRNGCDTEIEGVVLRTKNNLDKPKEIVTNNRFEGRNLQDDNKWKAKYEEVEKKRKALLTESQKLTREKNNLEQTIKKLEDDNKQLSTELSDKTNQLNRLRRVSEQVYQDYDKLNNKYETETTTLHKALEVASKWYKENKKLKRESIALRSTAVLNPPLEAIKDETDGDETQGQDELEELRKTVQDLSNQVGQLQSELNKARLQEFEAQEQFVNFSQALEEEKLRKEKMEKELKELRLMKEKFESVSYMVHDEMEALRTERDKANEAASRLQAEAQQAQKERNVLAHQSSLLMGEISSNETLMKVLMEAEDLKRKLEEETQNHAMEIQKLQEKLEYRESDAQIEILEEKLRLTENDLQMALQRAEQAEQAEAKLNKKIAELKSTGDENTSAIPPPPPPPPPPPFMASNATAAILKKPESNRERINTNGNGNSLDDMANILGIQRTPKTNNVAGGAIDDLINEIKGGKFTLKATEKQKTKKEEPPPAVQEMLNIIGTLKRRPRRSKTADVLS